MKEIKILINDKVVYAEIYDISKPTLEENDGDYIRKRVVAINEHYTTKPREIEINKTIDTIRMFDKGEKNGQAK